MHVLTTVECFKKVVELIKKAKLGLFFDTIVLFFVSHIIYYPIVNEKTEQ